MTASAILTARSARPTASGRPKAAGSPPLALTRGIAIVRDADERASITVKRKGAVENPEGADYNDGGSREFSGGRSSEGRGERGGRNRGRGGRGGSGRGEGGGARGERPSHAPGLRPPLFQSAGAGPGPTSARPQAPVMSANGSPAPLRQPEGRPWKARPWTSRPVRSEDPEAAALGSAPSSPAPQENFAPRPSAPQQPQSAGGSGQAFGQSPRREGEGSGDRGRRRRRGGRGRGPQDGSSAQGFGQNGGQGRQQGQFRAMTVWRPRRAPTAGAGGGPQGQNRQGPRFDNSRPQRNGPAARIQAAPASGRASRAHSDWAATRAQAVSTTSGKPGGLG